MLEAELLLHFLPLFGGLRMAVCTGQPLLFGKLMFIIFLMAVVTPSACTQIAWGRSPFFRFEM
jgi:hypothetical protein